MADEKDKSAGTPEDLKSLRRLSIYVFLVLSVVLVLTDTLGRLFIDKQFHIDSVVLGFCIGALLALLGLEGLNRAMGGK